MGKRLTTAAVIIVIAVLTAVAYTAIKGWRGAIVATGVSLVGVILGAEMYSHLGGLRLQGPSPFDRAMATVRSAPERPRDLVTIERAFGWRNYSSDEFEHRIKPVLVRLHRHVLAERKDAAGIRPFEGPLSVLAPGAPAPDALDTAALARIVDAIEDLGSAETAGEAGPGEGTS